MQFIRQDVGIDLSLQVELDNFFTAQHEAKVPLFPCPPLYNRRGFRGALGGCSIQSVICFTAKGY